MSLRRLAMDRGEPRKAGAEEGMPPRVPGKLATLSGFFAQPGTSMSTARHSGRRRESHAGVGRDAFRRVPEFGGEDRDAVERVPTGFRG